MNAPMEPSAAPSAASNGSLPVTPLPKTEEMLGSLSLLLQLAMLGLAFVLGHILRRRRFYYVHEASAALMLGLVFGIVANISNTEERFKKWLNFKEEFFLLFLLPPIIFESGFSLQPKPFFSNFAAICTFAIIGTFVSVMVTGVLVFIGGFLHIMYKLPFIESLIFGSLISATDPVTVLAIFQDLGGDMNLYALVFGESVLNDAVAIVSYRTLLSFQANPLADRSLYKSVQLFTFIFLGSILVGVGVALSCALLFKYAGLKVHNLHNLECCLFLMFPYAAYMLAESVTLSGIVAILFCGILMKHYTFPNLSEHAQIISDGFFKIIASLAETFVFIYMGVAIAIMEQSWRHVGFIFFSLIFIFIARAANVFPCAYLINLFRPAAKQIPMTHQKALWFSGLRGAMAFALALQSIHDLPDDAHGRAIFTTTTAIVVVTVIFVGGSMSTMLERLDLSGEGYRLSEEVGTLEEELLGPHHALAARIESDDEARPLRLESPGSQSDTEAVGSPTSSLTMRLRQFQTHTAFSSIDRKYIRPFFTSSKSSDDLTDVNDDAGIEMPQGKPSPSRKAKTTMRSAGSSTVSLDGSQQLTPPPRNPQVTTPTRWPSAGDGRSRRPGGGVGGGRGPS